MNYHSQQYDVEVDKEAFIETNLEALRDVHAENYAGTDDDMPDAFNNWLDNNEVGVLLKMLEDKYNEDKFHNDIIMDARF